MSEGAAARRFRDIMTVTALTATRDGFKLFSNDETKLEFTLITYAGDVMHILKCYVVDCVIAYRGEKLHNFKQSLLTSGRSRKTHGTWHLSTEASTTKVTLENQANQGQSLLYLHDGHWITTAEDEWIKITRKKTRGIKITRCKVAPSKAY